jgi:hypothetical protein
VFCFPKYSPAISHPPPHSFLSAHSPFLVAFFFLPPCCPVSYQLIVWSDPFIFIRNKRCVMFSCSCSLQRVDLQAKLLHSWAGINCFLFSATERLKTFCSLFFHLLLWSFLPGSWLFLSLFNIKFNIYKNITAFWVFSSFLLLLFYYLLFYYPLSIFHAFHLSSVFLEEILFISCKIFFEKFPVKVCAKCNQIPAAYYTRQYHRICRGFVRQFHSACTGCHARYCRSGSESIREKHR